MVTRGAASHHATPRSPAAVAATSSPPHPRTPHLPPPEPLALGFHDVPLRAPVAVSTAGRSSGLRSSRRSRLRLGLGVAIHRLGPVLRRLRHRPVRLLGPRR